MAKRKFRNDRPRRLSAAVPLDPGELGRDLASMVAAFPGVTVKNKGKVTNFSVGGKLFGFTNASGDLILKLPADMVERVVDRGVGIRLVMGTRVMKEWIVIHSKPAVLEPEIIHLLNEAKDFVSSLRN